MRASQETTSRRAGEWSDRSSDAGRSERGYLTGNSPVHDRGDEHQRSTRSATRSSRARPPTSSPPSPLPASFRGAVVRADEQEMFAGVPSDDKDPRKSLHIDEVPLPELAPDEALVAVMASSINFNTVWTSIFEPLPTFAFLKRLGQGERVGRAPRPAVPRRRQRRRRAWCCASARRCASWKPGDAVTVHCNHVDDQDPSAHDDSMLATNQRIWGYETNFGGLGEIAVVKANQLMPKPAHLTWEEAAVNALTNSTSYRMLVSPNGAQMTQGQTVLIWGASGGIGAYACQYVLNGGGTPVGGRVVARARRAAARDGRRARDRPQGRGLPVLVRRAHPGPGRVASARQEDPRARRAPIPRSCSSTPVAPRWARRCSCARAAARSSRARPRAAS